jgi:uncharacterized membrane protein
VPRFAADWSRSAVASAVMVAFIVVVEVVTAVAGGGSDVSGVVVSTTSASVLLATYQGLTWWRFRSASADTLASWARATNPRTQGDRVRSRLFSSTGKDWSLIAAVVALVAVVAINTRAELRTDPWVLGTSLLLVAVAWTGVVVGSAVAYLREHAERGGLALPDGVEPDWGDLVYLAVQVSTTFATSDVSVTTRAMRRLVTTHSLVAFVFNTVIVAVLVSSLLGVVS